MEDKALEILNKYWGYVSFRSRQYDIISSILNGSDTLALLPTAGGKSICFQIPALMLNGLTIVVSPLMALMHEQVYNLNLKGIKADFINSSRTFSEIESIYDKIYEGDLKLLYITPERINSEDFLSRAQYFNVSLVAVDEAHCISDWGNDFRPSYRNISILRKIFNCPIIALTATATPKVSYDIVKNLNFRSNYKIISDTFLRENLSYNIIKTENKHSALLDILSSNRGKSTIIYCSYKKEIHSLLDFLTENGIFCTAYHASLPTYMREKAQKEWLLGLKDVMIATNAFGMGIDKPNVRLVVHWNIPTSLESYFQEAGRAGRDGESSRSIIFANYQNISSMKYFADNLPSSDELFSIYQKLCGYFFLGENESMENFANFDFKLFCIKYSLDSQKTRKLMSELYNFGIINLRSSEAIKSKIRILINTQEIYQLKNTSFRQILITLARTYPAVFDFLVEIDIQKLVEYTYFSFEELKFHLDNLQNFGYIHYLPAETTAKLAFCQVRESEIIKQHIERKLNLKQSIQKEKVDAMLEFLNSQHCRSLFMQHYFGENATKKCGICDVCNKDNNVFSSLEDALRFKGKLTLQQVCDFCGIDKEEAKKQLRYLLNFERVSFDGEKWFLID